MLMSYLVFATDISDKTFLISKINSQNINNSRTWIFLQNNNTTGIEIEILAKNKNVYLQNSNDKFETILKKIEAVIQENPSKVIPVFIRYDDNILLLDSIINVTPT